MKKAPFFIVALFVLVSACTKTDNVTITGNTPPPDHTIDSSTLLIYVNKAYINMLGRKPVGTEQSSAMAMLRMHNYPVTDRQQFIQTLFAKPEYNKNLYFVANNQYLRGTDSGTIVQDIFMFNYFLTQPQYSIYYSQFTYEVGRLDTLQNTLNYMNAGTMDYRGMLTRMANNYVYDQINM